MNNEEERLELLEDAEDLAEIEKMRHDKERDRPLDEVLSDLGLLPQL